MRVMHSKKRNRSRLAADTAQGVSERSAFAASALRRTLLRRALLHLHADINRPTKRAGNGVNAMSDEWIFLKAAGVLVVAYWLLRGWQWHKARAIEDDPWSKTEHR